MAKVLIIDDEPNIRKALREILEYEKHEVFEAENAKYLEKKAEQDRKAAEKAAKKAAKKAK